MKLSTMNVAMIAIRYAIGMGIEDTRLRPSFEELADEHIDWTQRGGERETCGHVGPVVDAMD